MNMETDHREHHMFTFSNEQYIKKNLQNKGYSYHLGGGGEITLISHF